MIIENLNRDHLFALEKQGSKDATDVLRLEGYLESLMVHGPTFAAIVKEGVVAAMGMIEQNEGNFRCWAITDNVLARKYLITLTRAMAYFMDRTPHRRIETIVQAENTAGHRWVKLLKFGNQFIMHNFNHLGDAYLYERLV
jgi:hypothetical protein